MIFAHACVKAGKVLSVNVGLPRDVRWQGKTVRTAIWKEPVDGPRMVRQINIDGDDQADRAAHGGEHRAVFVYQIESYRYWEELLGRDDFTYGQFARTSRSRVSPTTRSASATDTRSGKQSSKSPNHA